MDLSNRLFFFAVIFVYVCGYLRHLPNDIIRSRESNRPLCLPENSDSDNIIADVELIPKGGDLSAISPASSSSSQQQELQPPIRFGSLVDEIKILTDKIKWHEGCLEKYQGWAAEAKAVGNKVDTDKYEELSLRSMVIIQGLREDRGKLEPPPSGTRPVLEVSELSELLLTPFKNWWKFIRFGSNSTAIESNLYALKNQVVDLAYNPLTRGDHIVQEFFDYIPRDTECENIVKLMKSRQEMRSKNRWGMDKISNPLIAVPGSPGIGKSTFLKHFPASEAYKEYISDRTTRFGPAIISLITFNGAMSGTSDALGLRILYGVLASTDSIDFTMTWDSFYTKNSYLRGLSADKAVKILRNIFGVDCPILITVDELSTSKFDVNIMKQLTTVLNRYKNVDIVVSSLSALYVQELLVGSNRPIKYVVLSSLIDEKLGKNECSIWADSMIANAGGPSKVNEYVQVLLYNIYLLYSGHPRALEMMVKSFKDTENWRQYDADVGNRDVSRPELLFSLLNKFPLYKSSISSMDEEEVVRYVLSTPSICSVDDKRFRYWSEEGKLLISKAVSDSEFMTCVPSIALLKCSPPSTYNASKVLEACKLLNDFKNIRSVGIWWERIVGLNIITRSGTFGSMSNLLGIKRIVNDTFSNWNIEVQELLEHDPTSLANCLILPSVEDHLGNDGSLKLFNDKLKIQFQFFLQMKISLPIKNSLLKIVASMICFNLLESINDNNIKLKHTHMVLYIWNISDIEVDSVVNGKDVVLANEVSSMVETIRKYTVDNGINFPNDFESIVRTYIEECYDTHVHVVRNSAMRNWLSPSLVSFPMFFTEIQ